MQYHATIDINPNAIQGPISGVIGDVQEVTRKHPMGPEREHLDRPAPHYGDRFHAGVSGERIYVCPSWNMNRDARAFVPQLPGCTV